MLTFLIDVKVFQGFCNMTFTWIAKNISIHSGKWNMPILIEFCINRIKITKIYKALMPGLQNTNDPLATLLVNAELVWHQYCCYFENQARYYILYITISSDQC